MTLPALQVLFTRQPSPPPDTAPRVETARTRAWCHGELLSYARIDGSTEDGLRRAVADAEAGRLQCQSLNGRFVLILQSRADGSWQVITDRLGAQHIYALGDDRRVSALGTDLLALSRQAPTLTLDWPALASFFSFGFYLDDRTCFDGIRVLQPASVYRFSAQGELIYHERYWLWQHQVDPARTYDETIEEYDALLRRAVRRCTSSGRAILPLSGGLDSRSLAAVMPAGAQPQAYSYGYGTDSIETRIASQVAAARGFNFTAHAVQPYLFDRLPEIVRALHGCQDVTQARQMSINGWVAGRADAVLTGLWGDVWLDQMGLADGIPPDTTLAEYTLHKFEKRGRQWLLEHVVGPHFLPPAAAEFLSAAVSDGLAGFEHIADLDFRVKAYKTSRWAFRWSNASLRGFDVGATARVPYYDVDLVDFFCTVPTEYVRDRRLQIDHLKRYAPDLARIRWQPTYTNLYLTRYSRWLSLPPRAINKLRRIVTRRPALQRNWEVQFLSAEGRRGLERWLLQPGLRLHDIVAAQRIASLLDEFYRAPTAGNGYTVSMLLTFSAWLEVST